MDGLRRAWMQLVLPFRSRYRLLLETSIITIKRIVFVIQIFCVLWKDGRRRQLRIIKAG